MFSDKRHSKRGVFSCVLGAAGFFALIGSVVRMCAAGGEVLPAQTISLALAFCYGVTGLALAAWMLVRGDTFRLFPALGAVINSALLFCLSGLVLWGRYGG